MELKNRKLLYCIAALLSFLFPGMGHVFIGKIKRGLAIFVLFYIVLALPEIYTTVFQTKLVLLFISCIVGLVLRFFIVLDAVRLIKKAYFDRSRSRWFYYVIMLAILIALGLISRIYVKPNLRIQYRKASFEMFDDVIEKGDYFAFDTDLSVLDLNRFDFIIYEKELRGDDEEYSIVGKIIGLPGERVSVINDFIILDDSISIPMSDEVLSFFSAFYGYSTEIDSDSLLLLTNTAHIPAYRQCLHVVNLDRIKGDLLYIYFPFSRIRNFNSE